MATAAIEGDLNKRERQEEEPARRSKIATTPNSPPQRINGEMAPASTPEPDAAKAPEDHTAEPGVLPDR